MTPGPEIHESVRKYVVEICDDCMNLIGPSCNTPGCVFIRHRIETIRQLLKEIQVRDDNHGIKQKHLE